MTLVQLIDWHFAATLGIPALVGIFGWFFVHWLNSRRDVAVRKREARLKALEAAYMRIATVANRPLDKKAHEALETFVAEIQLYGSPRQIQLMTEIVEEFKKPNNTVSFDPILEDLRDSIRKELKLEVVKGHVWWLRFNQDERKDDV